MLSGLLLLLAASLVSPLGALAAGSTHSPIIPGPHSGARSSSASTHAPSGRVPAAPLVAGPLICDATFHTVASPNSINHNILVSTSAVSANDVWAVGNTTNIGVAYDQTLAEHWDGSSWNIVPTSNPGAFHNDLTGVVAISTNDVWVVGIYVNDPNNTTSISYAQHWNGTSWSGYVFAPTSFSFLLAVTASSSTDVWAVGDYFSAGTFLPMVEHWNGTTWSLIPAISNSFDNEFFAVSAWSATDVWAVGEQSLSGQPFQALAEHWNGATWSVLATPNTLSGDNQILGVSALEAGHAVGVGYGNFTSDINGVTLTPRQSESWDLVASGTSTNNASLGTGLGTGDNALLGVGRSAGGVWAVGYSRATIPSPRQTLVIPSTWDSAAHTLTWGAVGTSASPDVINDVLFSVTAVSPYVFWATGYKNNNTTFDQTLAESYCAQHFSLIAPATTTVGSMFSLTVTVQNGDGTTVTGYRGTVHFTSSDLSATLPANYTFTPADNGVHTFAGVVLNTPGNQTITPADMVMPFTMPGSVTIRVLCVGACPAPPGTPGGRGANPGPAGTSGARGANQSGAGAPGPRLPRMGPVASSGDSTPGVVLATATGLESQAGSVAANAGSNAPQPAAVLSGLVGSGTISASVQAAAQDKVLLAARRERVLPPPGQSLWYVLPLVPLLVCMLALGELRRRRFKEKSNAPIRP